MATLLWYSSRVDLSSSCLDREGISLHDASRLIGNSTLSSFQPRKNEGATPLPFLELMGQVPAHLCRTFPRLSRVWCQPRVYPLHLPSSSSWPSRGPRYDHCVIGDYLGLKLTMQLFLRATRLAFPVSCTPSFHPIPPVDLRLDMNCHLARYSFATILVAPFIFYTFNFPRLLRLCSCLTVSVAIGRSNPWDSWELLPKSRGGGCRGALKA